MGGAPATQAPFSPRRAGGGLRREAGHERARAREDGGTEAGKERSRTRARGLGRGRGGEHAEWEGGSPSGHPADRERAPSRAGGGTRRTTAGAPREPRLRGPPGRGGPDPGKAPRGPAAAPPRPETRRGHRAGGGAATGDDRRRRRWQGGTRPPPKPSTRPPRGRRGGDRGQGAPRGGGGHGSSGGPGRGRWGAEPGRDNKGVGRDRLKGGEDGHRAQPLPRRCTTPPFLRATAARSATPRAAVAALPRASGRPLPLFSLSPAHTRFFSRPSRPAGRHRAGPPAPHG